MLARKNIDYQDNNRDYRDISKSDIDLYKRQQKRKQNAIRNKRRTEAFIKAITILLAFVLMGTLLLYLIGYANITRSQIEVSELEEYKVELEKEKNDLEANIEGIKSSTEIKENAQYKLGMIYPSKDQIVYISIADEIKEEDTNKVGLNGLERVLSFVSSLF